jgi:prevent-host-death family protein
MKSVNIAELKNRLSAYLSFARNGEEIVIRDRNLPVAKLVPFSSGDASDEELLLVAVGKMRLPRRPLEDIEEIWKIPAGTVPSSNAIKAVLEDREEGL